MTITAVANPTASPPEVTVSVATPIGSVMSAVTVWRNDPDGRTLLREQPAAGFDSRTVTDVECPYEVARTYYWEATYTSSFSTLFDETWASLAAWSNTTGWNVSGGKARYNTGGASMSRAIADGKYRFTIGSISATPADLTAVYLTGGGNSIKLNDLGTYLGVGSFVGGVLQTYSTTIDPSQPITIDYGSSSVTITGTGGSLNLPFNLTVSGILFDRGLSSGNTFQIGAFKAESYGVPVTVEETSDPVTLIPSPLRSWLINPASPGLSVPMTNTAVFEAGIVSIGPVENESSETLHTILGSKTVVPTNTGPRADDTSEMVIWTYTNDERTALRALLADGIPILIQLLPSWLVDFNTGFYSVGKVREVRDYQNLYHGDRSRLTTLPLVKVQSPVVDVQNTGWSFAAIALEWESFDDAEAPFATFEDMRANNRS